jgi:hypothetical protein
VAFDAMSECGKYRSVNGSTNESDWLLPSGAIARSFFNDTYKWISPRVDFAPTGIAWRSDKQKLFKRLSSEYTGIRWMEDPAMNSSFPGATRNEHFIVWMRTAALPTFIKLYGRCMQTELEAGDYVISIGNNYPTEWFNGEKHIRLSTVGPLGGRNDALGISYMLVGGVMIAMGVCIVICRIMFPRRLGDASYLIPRS